MSQLPSPAWTPQDRDNGIKPPDGAKAIHIAGIHEEYAGRVVGYSFLNPDRAVFEREHDATVYFVSPEHLHPIESPEQRHERHKQLWVSIAIKNYCNDIPNEDALNAIEHVLRRMFDDITAGKLSAPKVIQIKG